MASRRWMSDHPFSPGVFDIFGVTANANPMQRRRLGRADHVVTFLLRESFSLVLLCRSQIASETQRCSGTTSTNYVLGFADHAFVNNSCSQCCFLCMWTSIHNPVPAWKTRGRLPNLHIRNPFPQ